jgi:hypothetical protein
MKARAEVIDSPGDVIVAFSASKSWSSFIKKSSPSFTSTPKRLAELRAGGEENDVIMLAKLVCAVWGKEFDQDRTLFT